MNADPFGTERLRDAAMLAWRSSPTRFREDANAEEDLVLGGYRDRWLVELAQNAADAAARGNVAGHLRISRHGDELRVANTGAPLDSAGVASLASLRASAKRDDGSDTVGRFGIGFAAVLTVSTEPRVVSTTGGVAFSASRTADLVAAEPQLRDEALRRSGRVPVLRLPWPTDESPPDGFDTEVRLPLRPGVDGAALLADAAGQAADLLLALPTLHRIDVDDLTFRREDEAVPAGEGEGADARAETVALVGPQGTTRWRLVRRRGVLPAELVTAADDRHRPRWSVCWAVPLTADGAPSPIGEDVLHAPTPTDERLSLPARLLTALPVEPSRRRIRPGAATDHVLREAALVYPELVLAVAAEHRTALVPPAGFPLSDVDSTLRDGVVEALRNASWLPGATQPGVAQPGAAAVNLSPTKASVLDVPAPGLVELIADLVPGLLAAPLSDPAHAPALVVLDVPRLGVADVVAAVTGIERPPRWWLRLYQALAPIADVDPTARENLAALPVPLADGRTVTGPRSTVLLETPVDGAVPGLRVVHPEAVHPLLDRLGALRSGPRELLAGSAVREAVERSLEDAEAGVDVSELVGTVLGLVAAVSISTDDLPWLGSLALPSADGEPRRADELVLPDGALRSVLAADAPLGVLRDDVAGAHPRSALRSVGVLDGFAVVVDEDPIGPDPDLPDSDAWWATLDEPPARLVAVRDLDLVDDDAWPLALRLLAAEPDTSRAMREPYTRWWLARNALLAGRPLRHWRLAGADGLAGLYDVAPDELPELAAAGVRAGLSVDDLDDAEDLLARLADSDRTPSPATVLAAHAALTSAATGGVFDAESLRLPATVRAVTGEVVHSADAYVLDRPWLAGIADPDCLVAGGDPPVLADLLDLPLASEVLTGEVVSSGHELPWSRLPDVAAACEALGRPVPVGSVILHDQLVVRDGDDVEHEVPYWVAGDRVHAADPVRAMVFLGGAGPTAG